MGEDESAEGYALACPFWIDTDAYSDRDRLFFVYGFEFATILEHIRRDDGPLEKPIHRENESRVRMACGRFGRSCRMEYFAAEQDPAGTWVSLTIDPR